MARKNPTLAELEAELARLCPDPEAEISDEAGEAWERVQLERLRLRWGVGRAAFARIEADVDGQGGMNLLIAAFELEQAGQFGA